jgi:U3 small nucleolar RNA-associated protein 14
MKAKRVKKIKSRTYHRLLKKDKRKASSADLEADPEAAEESAMKQEFKRAEVVPSLF